MPYTGKFVSDYITQWLYDNGKSSQQVPIALPRFNRRMHELEEEIVDFVNNDLYGEAITIDLDLWVQEYDLPSGNSVDDDDPLIPQLKKCLEVAVMYDPNQTMPTKCREFSRDNFEAPENRYKIYQSTLIPMFGFRGKKIVIYPEPTIDVTNGLTIRYAKSAVDAELTTQEDEFPFAWYYLNTILVGMTVDLVKANKWVWSAEYQSALWDRTRAKNKALGEISDRYSSVTNYKAPDLTFLMC